MLRSAKRHRNILNSLLTRSLVKTLQEKMRGRNRLVPRLLGVTKESVLRLDEKTKEILKTWPLTTVRRWAASPNVFTLDFGDYQDQYYSVQTTEGEQISQLIAGYIDIILKRRQKKERFGDDGNEEEAMEEDLVTPGREDVHPVKAKVGLPQNILHALHLIIKAEGENSFASGASDGVWSSQHHY